MGYILEIIQKFDVSMLNFFFGNIRFGILDAAMPIVSVLGDYGAIWVLAASALICIKRYRTVGITVLAALLLCGLIGNLGLKQLVARPRPYVLNPEIVLLIPQPADYSFPSGHTMSSFASSTVIFFHNRLAGCFTFLFGILMAFSRLYLCVHYATDVLGGIVIGTGIGITAVFVIRIARKRLHGV